MRCGGAAADFAGRPRRVLEQGVGGIRRVCGKARRARAHHLECKGAIPEDHPLRAGCIIGGIIEKALVTQADLIVTVGLDAVELQPKAWPYTLPVISLASTPSLDAFVPADPEIVGELKSLLAALARARAGRLRLGRESRQDLSPAGGRRAQHARHRAVAAARHGGRPRGAAAQHDRDLRRRREPPAGGAEMGGLRARASFSPPTGSAPWATRSRAPWRRGSPFRTGRWSPSPATAAS